MIMNVYRVKVIFETVVVAGNPASAWEAAEFAVKNEDEESVSCEATRIDEPHDLPEGWGLDCFPWGTNQFKNLGELLGYTKDTI
jgi:hypothetical protein